MIHALWWPKMRIAGSWWVVLAAKPDDCIAIAANACGIHAQFHADRGLICAVLALRSTFHVYFIVCLLNYTCYIPAVMPGGYKYTRLTRKCGHLLFTATDSENLDGLRICMSYACGQQDAITLVWTRCWCWSGWRWGGHSTWSNYLSGSAIDNDDDPFIHPFSLIPNDINVFMLHHTSEKNLIAFKLPLQWIVPMLLQSKTIMYHSDFDKLFNPVISFRYTNAPLC